MEQGFGFAHFISQCDAMGKGVLALLLIMSWLENQTLAEQTSYFQQCSRRREGLTLDIPAKVVLTLHCQ